VRFYLGTGRDAWLAEAGVPLFISHNQLRRRKDLTRIRAIAPWALDSGGFTELSQHGAWRGTVAHYIAAVRRYADDIGSLEWAAPMDWMCEPAIRRLTGLTVEQHQARTIANFLDLRSAAPELPFIPVLQGWEPADYPRHITAYARAGVDLTTFPLVGVGSVCRRQRTTEVAALLTELAGLGMKLHGFGVKTLGLLAAGRSLQSSDSAAWSVRARWAEKGGEPKLFGCSHRNCANCLTFALHWRGELLTQLRDAGVPVEDFGHVIAAAS
jgi:hypothetical protein